ncbi:MAG TPA: AmmeMemoRadiSam system protein B [Actinomycetota bacterium]|nr:AmmeMemoRadiSam system protein B [Actinomycetota bacterium]
MTPPVRRPVAGGTFYPGDPRSLAAEVDRLLSEAFPPSGVPDPLGLIVPHAGYRYSGPVAATAYALLSRAASRPDRVALLGPAHFVPLRGAAVSAARAWATPLGTVDVDAELAGVAAACGAVRDEEPHDQDHALEVQLPFLQRVLASALRVLPVAVGDADPGEIAALIGALADAGALVLVSTDLSHYRDHRMAQAIDGRTAAAVVARDAFAIAADAACGVHALRGLVAHARHRGLAITPLDLRTSGDVTGDRGSVVGYGAFAVVSGDH